MQLLGIIGEHLPHTLSPLIFNSLFTKLNLSVHYHAFAVAPRNLAAAVKGLKALNFLGANVTIPYKEKIIKHLDELSPRAEAIGAVNTLCHQDGRLVGFNTDAPGFAAAWREEVRDSFAGKFAVLVGAGGAAKSLAYVMAENNIRAVMVFNRTRDRALELADWMKRVAPEVKLKCFSFEELDAWQDCLAKAHLVLQTTPVGSYPETECAPLPLDSCTKGTVVYDVVYNPIKTEFLRLAEARGARIYNGLGMLVHQAALNFNLWFNLEAPVSFMRWVAWQSLQGGHDV